MKQRVTLFIDDGRLKEMRQKAIQDGKSLSDFVSTLSTPNGYTKGDLIAELAEAIEALYPVLKKNSNLNDMGVFLHQAINLYADEQTIKAIIADVRKHTDRFKKQQ